MKFVSTKRARPALRLANNLTLCLAATAAFVLFQSNIFAVQCQQAIPVANVSEPSTTTTTTTTAPITTTQPPLSSNSTTTMREPSEQEIQEARKIIHEIASTLKDNPSRLVVNKPVLSVAGADFAPDSLEARIADATSQFGLDFMKASAKGAVSASAPRENVLISPVSMQILLNIILLGTKDQSATQLELMETLNYVNATTSTTSTDLHDQERTRWPHVAMHSLLDAISRATHLTIDNSEQEQQQLLNSAAATPQLAGHLQTSVRETEVPLSGQVNFTLANLMLTNNDLVNTSSHYEQDLKRYYDIKLEHFSRQPQAQQVPVATTSSDLKLHERVNQWVKNITQGQIGSLVEESDLSGGNLAMILLNAAHFKGRWQHTFNTKLTQERTFFNEGVQAGATEAKFMRQNGVFGYAEFGSGSAGGNHFLGNSERNSNQYTSALTNETLLTEDSATVATPTTTTTTAAVTATKSAEDDEEARHLSAEAKRYELTARLNCSALMLPFSLNDGQELSMIVLLPHKRSGLDELIESLSGAALNEIYRSLNEQQVQVELPKFSFESAHDARATLLKMGLSKIFQDGAELDRMFESASGGAEKPSINTQNATQSDSNKTTTAVADDKAANGTTPTTVQPSAAVVHQRAHTILPVKVDKLIHKARIAVDEVGAEAAAASAATIVLRNLIRPPNPSFVADHPFLFIVRHNRSNLPLFMGRIDRL